MSRRIIIAGSRSFDNYELLCETLDNYHIDSKTDIIVSGGSKGADTLGERYAKEHGIHFKQFLADWDTLGKSAGYIRNKEMGNYATEAIIFWDGESKGSYHMINIMRNLKKGCRVVTF